MLRRLYDWTMDLAAHRHATWALAFVSFIESSFFPIPPHPVLMAMVLADRSKAWFYAAVTTAASVAGGIFGYIIGYYLFNLVGEPIVSFYGLTEKFEAQKAVFNGWVGAGAILFAGMSPFPYKIVTILSGITMFSFPLFILLSIVGRGLIFFIIAGLLYFYGPPIRSFIEERLGLLVTLFLITLIGGIALVKFVL